jgi:uncharacterized membrane protein YdbT with pleckstrin-like domain
MQGDAVAKFDAGSVTRPHRSLLTYYIICAILTGPAFFLLILPLLFKYETLRYRFDHDGVAMSWGILFRREIYLTYRRIQDIHVTRNILQRWMGLATVAVQTASGTSGAEMSIDGIVEYDQLRDFLYQRMRGAKGIAEHVEPGTPAPPADESLVLLRQIAESIEKLAHRGNA